MGEGVTLSIFQKEFPTPKSDGEQRGHVGRVVVPGGFDRFFAACAAEFKKGEPELPLLFRLAAEYGIEFQTNPFGDLLNPGKN